MNIMIVVEEFFPEKGYLEYYLATELVSRNHKVVVISFGESKQIETSDMTEGFRLIRLPYILNWVDYHLPNIKGFLTCYEALNTFKPHILLCQPVFSPLAIFLTFIQRIQGRAVGGKLVSGGPIATTSGMYKSGSVRSLLRYLLAKLVVDSYCSRMVQIFFVLNSALKSFILKQFRIRADKVRIMHLAAETSLFSFDQAQRTEIRTELGLDGNSTMIVSSGRIVPSKNLPFLVESVAPLIHENDSIHLLLIGDGDQTISDEIDEKISELKIAQNTVRIPLVHRTDLPRYFSASDIAVWIGSPSISIIEAMSIGLPIIVKKSPYTSYLVSQGNGYSIRPNDMTDLQSKLRTLISTPNLRERMGLLSRQVVEERLNYSKVTGQFLDGFLQYMTKSKLPKESLKQKGGK